MKMHHYKAAAGQSVDEMIAEMANDPSVEYVEPNYIVSKTEQVGVRGELLTELEFSSLASSTIDGSFSQTSAPIQADEAWDNLSDTSVRPIIAVIDTGVDYTHTAFTRWCAMWENTLEKNGSAGVDDDGNGYVDDIHGYDFYNNDGAPYDDDGHGTHVAGIALGATQDILASPEVAPSGGDCADGYESRVRIMAVKFLGADGNGTTSDAIKGIYYAINNGASVLNNSWGGGSYSRSLHDAIAYAYNRSIPVVAAAGNAASNNDVYPMFPANYDAPNVISVASTQSNDQISYFSNYGSSTVHMAAPGSAIYSTYPGNFYTYMSGTSMAAPFVSGVAAMILREQPSMNSFQLKEVITDASNNISSLSNYTISGKRLNANGAVLTSQGVSVASSQPSYSVNYSAFDRGPASAETSAGGCGMVSKLGKGGSNGKGFGSMVLLGLLLLPLVILFVLRQDTYRRQYERFEVQSNMKVKVGNKELVGAMESLSLGGAGIDVDELINSGSVVTMCIQKPDGSGEVEVKGKVVWSDGGKKYGIQFTEHKRRMLNSIRQLISQLVMG